ncbi:MAG: 50S ribosomal protein L27 [Patescibacteria group bacterium]
MAHTKAQRAVKGNRDSKPKMRGIKKFGGETVIPGNVIIRQKGTKFHAGAGTMLSRDFTIIALKKGIVAFKLHHEKRYVYVK